MVTLDVEAVGILQGVVVDVVTLVVIGPVVVTSFASVDATVLLTVDVAASVVIGPVVGD